MGYVVTGMDFPGTCLSEADISPDGLYRYRLRRRWSTGPSMLFVMLNPSKADAEKNDPTIRRCLGFAKREHCAAIEVVNLFAFRATNPAELGATPHDPVGHDNDEAIISAARAATIIVAAWGAGVPRRWSHRPADALYILRGRSVLALGISQNGAPRHPLYLPADAPLVRLQEGT